MQQNTYIRFSIFLSVYSKKSPSSLHLNGNLKNSILNSTLNFRKLTCLFRSFHGIDVESFVVLFPIHFDNDDVQSLYLFIFIFFSLPSSSCFNWNVYWLMSICLQLCVNFIFLFQFRFSCILFLLHFTIFLSHFLNQTDIFSLLRSVWFSFVCILLMERPAIVFALKKNVCVISFWINKSSSSRCVFRLMLNKLTLKFPQTIFLSCLFRNKKK